MITDPPRLLDELCVKLGICLDPPARSRIGLATHRDIESVEVAVLEAGGLDPVSVSRRLRHDLHELIARYWE